jgi:hypothetical protein
MLEEEPGETGQRRAKPAAPMAAAFVRSFRVVLHIYLYHARLQSKLVGTSRAHQNFAATAIRVRSVTQSGQSSIRLTGRFASCESTDSLIAKAVQGEDR